MIAGDVAEEDGRDFRTFEARIREIAAVLRDIFRTNLFHQTTTTKFHPDHM